MLHNKVPPAVNQIEVNPFLQQRETQQFLQANRVQLEAWAPFAEGRNHVFENPTLRAVATKHKKSLGAPRCFVIAFSLCTFSIGAAA
jgi:2,5-diketo-D-gluconate reductase A